MSAQPIGITRQEFLNGQAFSYQTQPAIQYVLWLDTGATNAGMLIPKPAGKPVSVFQIGDSGFRCIVDGKPWFIAYFDCHPVKEAGKS